MALNVAPAPTAWTTSFTTRRRLVAGASVAVAALGGIAGAAFAQGNGLGVSALLAIGIAVLVWRAPWTATVAIMLAATLVEQFTLSAQGAYPDFTDQFPLFRSLSSSGISGIYATPFELLIGFALLVWFIRGFSTHRLRLPKSKLSLAMGLFSCMVVYALLRGFSFGASLRNSLWELRPWMYLVLVYVISSQLITKEKHLKVLLWTFALGVAIKAAQGDVLLAIHPTDRPQSFLAHAESFFFGVYLTLTLGLWLLSEKGRLRTFMTITVPIVLLADMGNQRRTGWAILGLTVLVAMILAYVRMPHRRRKIATAAVIICICSGIYYALFSNHAGTLGQPARAFKSAVFPDARDKASNRYRTVEDVDLGIAIRLSTPLGSGFGQLIPQPVQNVNITAQDSFINYVPHNGILYVWLRFGLLGAVCFWMMIGIAIMLASESLRSQRRMTTLISFLVLTSIMAYIVQGFYDMGLFWFRMAAFMGLLFGALEVVRRLDRTQGLASEAPGHEALGARPLSSDKGRKVGNDSQAA